MDLKHKIARLMMSSVSGRESDSPVEQYRRLKDEIARFGLGGYVIFGGNVESTADMIVELGSLVDHGLVVASDLERGLGQQLEGGTVFPSQMALGATGQPDLVHAQGFLTALEAGSVGINMVLAPVADVNTEPRNPIIGVRSYGEDPDLVASLTAAFVRGCQLGGAAAVAKHFPGHGDACLDSHVELPRVDADLATLRGRELLPFRAAIEESVWGIMTAHVAYPSVTGDDTPATFSRELLDRLLRKELGFEGVVLTDALIMGAVTETAGAGDAALLALKAGADLLLMPSDVGEAIEVIYRSVRTGELDERRIDASIARVDALLAWLASRPDPDSITKDVDLSVFADQDNQIGLSTAGEVASLSRYYQTARHAAAMCGTLLRNEDDLVPLDPDGLAPERTAVYLVVEEAHRQSLVWLRAELDARLPGVIVKEVRQDTPQIELETMVELAGSARHVLVFIFDDVAAWRGRFGLCDEHAAFLDSVIRKHPGTVITACASPQIAAQIPSARSLVCFYDGAPATQEAAVRALFGEIALSGRLPVSVPGLFNRGHGPA